MSNTSMLAIRVLDLLISFVALVIFIPFLLVIYILGMFDTGSPLFFQQRVGLNKKPFNLVKFRTMQIGTANTATHLASVTSITSLGKVLRKTKLDELPQLWNVLVGEMSLVGPRPNLYNQEELVCERESLGVYSVRPGITGLAQVNDVDMSTPKLLAITDKKMIDQLNIRSYFKLLFLTVIGKGYGDRIKF